MLIRRTGELSTTRLPSCAAILSGDQLRAAHEPRLLGAAAGVEVALERAGVVLVARGGEVEQREEQRELPRLGAEDRPRGRGHELLEARAVELCCSIHVSSV